MSSVQGPSTVARPARDSASVSELPAEPARDSLRRIGVGRSVEWVVGVGGRADAIDHQGAAAERVVVAERDVGCIRVGVVAADEPSGEGVVEADGRGFERDVVREHDRFRTSAEPLVGVALFGPVVVVAALRRAIRWALIDDATTTQNVSPDTFCVAIGRPKLPRDTCTLGEQAERTLVCERPPCSHPDGCCGADLPRPKRRTTIDLSLVLGADIPA